MIKKLISNEERIAFLNKKAVELSSIQEDELISDYDEALSEYKNQNKPWKIKFKGEIIEIPRSIPFSFSMFCMKHCYEKKGDKTVFKIPNDKVDEFICRMFGEEFFEILEKSDGVDMQFVLGTLVSDIFNKWGYSITKPKSMEKNG